MNHPLHVTAVIGIFLRAPDQILTIHNKRGVDVPGGHVEPGEDMYQALERELFEEAGATASDLQVFYTLTGPYRQHPVSAMVFMTGTIISYDQHKSEWMSVSDLMEQYTQDQQQLSFVLSTLQSSPHAP